MQCVFGMITCHFSRRTLAMLSVFALVLSAAACSDKSSSSTTGPTGCQIITGVTTTTFPASGGTASISFRAQAPQLNVRVDRDQQLRVPHGHAGRLRLGERQRPVRRRTEYRRGSNRDPHDHGDANHHHPAGAVTDRTVAWCGAF